MFSYEAKVQHYLARSSPCMPVCAGMRSHLLSGRTATCTHGRLHDTVSLPQYHAVPSVSHTLADLPAFALHPWIACLPASLR